MGNRPGNVQIDENTNINTLLNQHPELEDFLINYHRAFRRLKSPILRRTMGKVATMRMAASLAGIPVEKLIHDLKAQLAKTQEPGKATGPNQQVDKRAKKNELKELLKALHAGAPFKEIEARFGRFAEGLTGQDIAQLEQELIAEGIKEDEIKALCDYHARLMGQKVEPPPKLPPGHPAHTLIEENRRFETLAAKLEEVLQRLDKTAHRAGAVRIPEDIYNLFELLGRIDVHYKRKEHQIFPFLEKNGITGPPQVMWAVHDDIRTLYKKAKQALEKNNFGEFRRFASQFLVSMREMFYKEERILIPMCMDTFTVQEWLEILEGEPEIGYCFDPPKTKWNPEKELLDASSTTPRASELLALDTGALSLPQVNLMLTHLPIDISFVDENDEVRYYSATKERIFPRSPGVIGRKVQKCHPPKSLHVVQEILDAFKTGRQDKAEFWLEKQGKFIYIQYVAIRDPLGKYRGCLEITQDVTRIRSLTKERRLLQWEKKEEVDS